MNLIYKVSDRPPFGKVLLFALQQLLAIVSATIAVPMIVGNGLQPSAALFGAGVATIIYLLITKFKSPVFFGSSFAFIGSMCAAFAGAVSMQLGYLGIILGSTMAGLVSIGAGLLVKKFGVNWIYKVLPYAVIGPVVAIIGLSLAGTAVGGVIPRLDDGSMAPNAWVSLVIGMITLFSTIAVATFGKKMMKLVPFAIGIGIGYVVSLIFTGFGYALDNDVLKVIDLSVFTNMQWYPEFTFIEAFGGFKDLTWGYVGTIALAFIPVAVVTMTEHISDHMNLSTIIESDLLKDPGLHRTLIGDGLADAAGAFLGGCSTTSYGESVGCVALTKNASVISIFVAALMAIAVSFIGPVSALLSTIPSCVLNAVCFLLYGFIAVSGLKMIKNVDLEDNKNVFVISVILVAGVGGFALNFGQVTITTVACALILGILVNTLVHLKFNHKCKCKESEKCCCDQTCTVDTEDETHYRQMDMSEFIEDFDKQTIINDKEEDKSQEL